MPSRKKPSSQEELDLFELINETLAPTERQALQQAAADVRTQLHDANARVKTLTDRALLAEKIREEVFNLKEQSVKMPPWMVERSKASDSPHVAMLITSDFQWGEVVDKDNMDGINEFNVAIAEKRYQNLIERTIDLSFEHLPNNKYDGLVLLRLGDTVSGDIHEDLRVTNELASISAVRSVTRAERWGIDQLKKAFGRVHVISVPGNHGRYQIKPPTKRIQDNYDTLASWWLESLFEGDSDITWQTPDSTDAVFDLHGRKYVATHGDNIGSRGGQGFIGPAATIMRGMKKTMDEYARRGHAISKMFVGHFHTAYDLGYGWSNGSLPGYSEFARVNRMTPEPPVQWLINFHPKWGDTSQWKIKLAPEPRGSASVTPFD
jgi:hypothetical protein